MTCAFLIFYKVEEIATIRIQDQGVKLELLELDRINKELTSALTAINEASKVSARLDQERVLRKVTMMSAVGLVLFGLVFALMYNQGLEIRPDYLQTLRTVVAQTKIKSVGSQTIPAAPAVSTSSQTISNSQVSDSMDFGPLGVGVEGEIIPLAGENMSIVIAIAEKFLV